MADREKISIDSGWKFHYGDIVSIRNRWAWAKSGSWNQGPESRDFDDSKWQDVELPHDFVIATAPVAYMEKEFTADNTIPAMEDVNNIHTTAGSFRKNVGWYRKHFYVPEEWLGRKIYLVFEGIYRDSSAYLNEFFIGSERSGYKQIVYDITDTANYGGDNLLSVRADARQAEGWFYEGGGIYRHAYLLVTSKPHIDNIFVWCDVCLEKKYADIHVQIETEYCTDGQAVITLSGPDGTNVAVQAAEVTENRAEAVLRLEDIGLWDIENPLLYSATAELFLKCDSVLENMKKTDTCTTKFGIRDIRFDGEKGFILNGKQVKLKGVCCHQNHGGIGSAIPDSVYRYRIKKLQEMGVNAYRTSHYPPSPALLDICDEMGMLVMDETRLLSSEQQDLEQLSCMVKRDRNHPSVILYSIGNEEAQSQTTPQGARIAGTMLETIKKLDPYTPVTMGLVMWDLKNRKPITDINVLTGISTQLDVAGFNYQDIRWKPYHEAYPKQPMVCTEQGSFKSTRGCYSTDRENCHLAVTDRTADSYMKGAQQWHVCRPDWMSGLFIWTGFDYYGEPTPFAWPAISSQFGAMDLCGYPKDFYYYYKAWWSDEDVVHLFPHWNGTAGEKKDIYVFSNCEEVELFRNGCSLGKKTMEQDGYLIWEEVEYVPGEIRAVGYREKTVAAVDCVKTVKEAAGVRLTLDFAEKDIRIFKVEVVDEDGYVVPDGDTEMVFSVDNGRILGTSNGNPSDHMLPNGSVRKAFHGLAQVIVKAENTVILTAESREFGKVQILV